LAPKKETSVRDDLTPPGVSARFKSDRATVIARRLRKEMTPAERALWFELRRLPIPDSHFRRQTPMGPFIVDFVCHGAKLVVEVDGSAHDDPARALGDVERQAWLEGRGYRVVRFTNKQVLASPAQVARSVFAEVRLHAARN
jgi:very-short-patch-repair endonuclease